MSNSLVKLIDSSLLPVLAIVIGKLLGIYIVSSFFYIDVNFKVATDSLLSLTPVVSKTDLVVVSTYSDLIMYLFIGVGFSITLLRSVYLHETHISVNTIIQLARYNLMTLVKTSYDLYHSAFTWLIYTWVANLLILINTLLFKTEVWLLTVTTIFSIALTIILFRDLFKEIELSKRKIGRHNLA
jgi:hypothetical protein